METCMELRDIEAFVAVAEELHFGRAAARLHISQPPLSNRIRQLEADLKVDLFIRSTRNVALTEAGQRLLDPARQVLNQLAIARAVADSIVTGEEGRVRVGFAGASSQRSLPMLSRAVRELHPGIELKSNPRHTCLRLSKCFATARSTWPFRACRPRILSWRVE